MIDEYVDEINRRLVMPARRRARIVAEVRDHLDDAVAEFVALGNDIDTAQARATSAFGSPPDLASQFNTLVAIGVLRRIPLVMAASGVAVAVAFVFAAVSPSARTLTSASVLQQVAFFSGVLGMQVALVAGVRALARVAARWHTTPTAADHRLVRRAGFVFSSGLTATALAWSVALATAGQAPLRCILGCAVMVVAALVVWSTSTGRLAPPDDVQSIPSGSTLGVAERALEWLSGRPRTWCTTVAVVAAVTAMPHAETTASGELAWGAIQAAAVVAGFIFLGPTLELRSPSRANRPLLH